MPKVNLSGPQKEIIELIAHIVVMEGINKNVEGMDGVFDRYINNTLTDKQRAIYQALQDRIIQVRKDLLRMTKEERGDA